MSKTKQRANGEGSIRQHKSGLWETRITIGIDFATGQPKRISRYTQTQEEAVKLLHQLSMLRDTSPKNFESMTFGDWLDLCLEVYMKPSLKQSTYLSYESYIRVHFKPALGDLLLSDIAPRLLQNFYNYKTEQEGLSPKTVVNLNLFLHKALSHAVNEGYIRSNPAESINLSRGHKPQVVILTRDEQAKLMRGSYLHRYGVFVRLTLFTGIRVGELLGLRWEDIDFSSGLMHIRRTLNRLNKTKRPTSPGESTTEIVIQNPKSENSVRSIPLLPAVMQDLLAWKAVQEQDRQRAGKSYIKSGYIVTNELGGYIEPRTFKDYYNQILALSELPHFTFHALRHTFASRAMEQGMDAKTLSTILGHYSVSFTLDTYAHVLDEHKQEGMALMNELYNLQPSISVESYPIVMTTFDDGTISLTAAGFKDVEYVGDNIALGLQLIKDSISEHILTDVVMPFIPPAKDIALDGNQVLLQLPA